MVFGKHGSAQRKSDRDAKKVGRINRIRGVTVQGAVIDPVLLKKFLNTQMGIRVARILGTKFALKYVKALARGDAVLLTFDKPNGNSVIQKKPKLEIEIYGFGPNKRKVGEVNVITDLNSRQILVKSPKTDLSEKERGIVAMFPETERPKIATLSSIPFGVDEVEFLKKFREACEHAFSVYSSLRPALKTKRK